MSAALRPATAADVHAVEALLVANHLPVAGLGDALANAVVACDGGLIVGAAGLELYEDGALLRSVVVSSSARGRGLGQKLTHAVLDAARARGVTDVYLLTTTAERFFPKLGFSAVSRENVPFSIRQSVEFRGACPDTAICMRKTLRSTE